VAIRYPTDEELVAEAIRRHNSHLHHRWHDPQSENHDLIGVVGERQWCMWNNVPMDMTPRLGGDDGIDIMLNTIAYGEYVSDIKCAAIAACLVVSVEELHKKIKKHKRCVYVLSQYHDDRATGGGLWAEILGWQTSEALLHGPEPISFGASYKSYYIPHPTRGVKYHADTTLRTRPMSELRAMLVPDVSGLSIDAVRSELRVWQERGLKGEPRTELQKQRVADLWARVDAEVAHWQEVERDAMKEP